MSDTISLNCFPKNMTEHLVATIKSILHETRVFPPDPEFIKQANLSSMEAYHALCAEAGKDLAAFWARLVTVSDNPSAQRDNDLMTNR